MIGGKPWLVSYRRKRRSCLPRHSLFVFACGERQWNARKRREIQNVDGQSDDCEGGTRSTGGNVSQINYQRSPAFAAESTILYDRLPDGWICCGHAEHAKRAMPLHSPVSSFLEGMSISPGTNPRDIYHFITPGQHRSTCIRSSRRMEYLCGALETVAMRQVRQFGFVRVCKLLGKKVIVFLWFYEQTSWRLVSYGSGALIRRRRRKLSKLTWLIHLILHASKHQRYGKAYIDV